jgi:hypothetical protein
VKAICTCGDKSKDQKKIKALNALNFLRQHPALNPDILGDSLFDGAWFHMEKCCKRGLSGSCRNMMSIYHGDKGWEKFKNRFEREYKNDSETEKKLQYIFATYKEVYGEPWIFDHVEYWYETTFFVYTGNPYDSLECMDYKNWDGYAGHDGGANSFEDALIKCATQCKRTFGSFNKDKDFFTEAEKKNNAEQNMFLGGEDVFCVDRNPEYLEVTDGMTNLRWLAWFIETDYCKKNWDFHIKDFKKTIGALKRRETKAHKQLVKRYS